MLCGISGVLCGMSCMGYRMSYLLEELSHFIRFQEWAVSFRMSDVLFGILTTCIHMWGLAVWMSHVVNEMSYM